MADDGWIVQGAPKKKAAAGPKPAPGVLRTGESANRPSPSGKKYPSSTPTGTPTRPKNAKSKPAFEHRNDETEYIYDPSKLTWTMPTEVFDKIIAKFPGLKTLSYLEYESRWSLMRQMENAHWYFTDDLPTELPSLGLKPVAAADFFAALLHHLVPLGVNPHYSPQRYTDEWQFWQKYCRVGGIALVRLNASTSSWEVLLAKNINTWFSELSTTWPGGKAELTDTTFWGLASRELKEEVGFEVTDADKARVVAVIEGTRALSFVIPIAFDDARIATMQKASKEIHSIIWAPVQMDMTNVKEPARETRSNGEGVLLTKEDPADLRMPYEFKENFKKLQQINFETKQEGIDAWLDKDPRVFVSPPQHSPSPMNSPQHPHQ